MAKYAISWQSALRAAYVNFEPIEKRLKNDVFGWDHV